MVWLRRAGIVLIVLLAGAALALWFLLQRSLPDYEVTVQAEGLGDRVEIIVLAQ